MTERHGSGYGDEGGQRPSGRGAVTERLAERDQGVGEIDLPDEATRSEAGDTVVSPTARPDGDKADRESSGAFEPADTNRTGSSSIFDVDERAKQEDLNRTGYEPPFAEPADTADPTEPSDAAAAPVADTPAEAPPVTAAPADTAAPVEAAAPAVAEAPEAPLGSLDAAGIRSRFLDIQAGFVDEPRQAVEEADRFVDDLVKQVADALRQQRGQLAGVTAEASTEDLRLALRAHRQFVDRLLGLAGGETTR
jgi:hypothetical protein